MDGNLLRENFARVAEHGDEVALFFYSHLFLNHPEVRDMFPVSMSAQRDRLLRALGRIVADAGDTGVLVPYLRDLGRDHRKFGALAGHYPAVGESLLATVQHFSGASWTEELRAQWAGAYQTIAEVMTAAAAEDTGPAWWEAQVIGHERRTVDTAALRVALAQPLPYRPGQSVGLECPQRPRLWRYFSPANAPRPDGTVDFHVRVQPGGAVSTVLVTRPPRWLRLGPPAGICRALDDQRRPVLMAAEGTGLAPLKAILEQLAQRPSPPPVTLLLGENGPEDLYDLPDLSRIAAGYRQLTLRPVVRSGAGEGMLAGTVPEALVHCARDWDGLDAYVCGPTGLVGDVVARLRALGVPRDRIVTEDFGGGGSDRGQ